jgi:hypothetical protein
MVSVLYSIDDDQDRFLTIMFTPAYTEDTLFVTKVNPGKGYFAQKHGAV